MAEAAGTESGAIPLTREDVAILELEGPTIAGHTVKVIRTGAPGPDREAISVLMADRIDSIPALKRKLGEGPSGPAWVDDDRFDLGRHVVPWTGEGPVDGPGLRDAVTTLFEQRLDRDRPLWRIDCVPLADGGTTLVWRIHHSLADGHTAMRMAHDLLWEPAGQPAEKSEHPRRAAARQVADDIRRRAHLAAFLHREFGRSRTRSPFDGRIGTRREIAFAEVSLEELHDAAKRLDGATLNDAVLSIVAGALRHWLELHHGSLGPIRVKVPVSLHHPGDCAANHDSFFSVPLPINELDPVERLNLVHAATSVRKSNRDAAELERFMSEAARVSPRLERFCARLEENPRRFAVNVSNVPGPREPVKVLEAPVSSLHSLAEIGEHHALRVSVISLASNLCFGFCADPAIVEDVTAMAEGVEIEAARLIEA